MTKALLKLFEVDRVAGEELLDVFLNHFHAAATTSTGIRFQSKEVAGGHYLDTAFGRHGEIADITLGPGFPEGEIADLRGKVSRALLEDQHPAVGQRVGFCSRPVRGHFRYRDRLQFLPVPDGAPQPPAMIADHPFLLQFSYTWSPEMTIRHKRADRVARDLFKLLNLLSDSRIHGEPRYGEFFWALHAQGDPATWTSAWEQSGYYYPQLSGEVKEYSDPTPHEAIELRPAREYYGHGRTAGGGILSLPDDLDRSLDIALVLADDETRTRLFRSVSYLDHAEAIWAHSSSLSFIGLVVAVESLMDKPERCPACNQPLPEAVERCTECGQVRFGTTRKFREFLETRVPFIDKPGWEWARRFLYGFRSDLAHGNDIMYADLSPLATFSMESMQERELMERSGHIVFTAIRNWLHSRVVVGRN